MLNCCFCSLGSTRAVSIAARRFPSIRRHGGEAAMARRAYLRLAARDRDAVNTFLESLVLYATDDLPTDVNGDGMSWYRRTFRQCLRRLEAP
jgi:hypothetical protein